MAIKRDDEITHDLRGLTLDDLHVLCHSLQRQSKHHQKSCDRLVKQLEDEPATEARTNALSMHLRNLIAIRATQIKVTAARDAASTREAEIKRLRGGSARGSCRSCHLRDATPGRTDGLCSECAA